MLEHYFRNPSLIRDLRSTVFGEGIDLFAEYMYQHNYAAVLGPRYLSAARHFAFWIELKGMKVERLTDGTVTAFVEHLAGCDCSVPHGSGVVPLRAAARHMLRILRESGRTSPAPTRPLTPIDQALLAFDTHLDHMQGARPNTRQSYGWGARLFLESRHISKLDDLGRLRAPDVIASIQEHAGRRKPATIKCFATALRSFFRFAQMKGACGPRLALAVPSIKDSSAGRLPKALTPAQAERFLRAFDRSSAIGRRDFAMARCLLDLGLRTGEVVTLQLEDIDWRAGTIRLVAQKGRRSSVLPITATAAAAVSAYLRRGRPSSDSRAVFVRHRVRVGLPLGKPAVTSAIRRGFERCGVHGPANGPRLLRRTAASRMVQGGANLKHVADVLRQRSITTTMIYTKVDLPHLAEVSMPWPEVR